MNDYARVRSKNEKKKNKRKLSLSSFSLEASFLPFWSVWDKLGEKTRDGDETIKKKKEKRKKKEERKKREESVGIRFSRIVSNNTRHKRRRRAHRRGVNARRNQKEETEKRS